MHEPELRASYRVLELPATASLEDVREAYRLLSRVWHPDRFARNHDLLAKANAHQQALNAAYQELVEAYAEGRAPLSDHSDTPASSSSAAAAASPTGAHRRARSTLNLTHWVRQRPLAAGVASLLVAIAAIAAVVFLRPAASTLTADGALTTLAVGGSHACAGAADRVFCSGGIEDERLDLADTVIALSAGLRHGCALLANGRVQCWGGNYSGQVGDRSLDDRPAPVAVGLEQSFVTLSALAYHTCGVTDSGAAYCWGNDTDGQLGVGRPVARCRWDALTFYCSDRPERIGRTVQWRAVAAGGSHTCAIDSAARVHCWGSNRSGQLGVRAEDVCRGPDGTQPCRRTPGLVENLDMDVIAIAAGAAHTCALDATGRVHCWGLNVHGEAGVSGSVLVAAPTAMHTSLRFTAIAAGGYHTCALTEAGALYCWGSDERGELDGEARERCEGNPCAPRPVLVRRAGVAEVATGFGRTCIRQAAGDVACWGRGESEAAAPPHRLKATREPGSVVKRVATETRWRIAGIKRFIHRNIVAPLDQQ